MRDIQLATGNYYHIYNRGVDKRNIFTDEEDFERFRRGLFLFNDANYSNPGFVPYFNETLLSSYEALPDDRDHLVNILAFCLLPNHFHLFIRQNQDGGIAKFLHKLGMGYAKFFNKKYGRSGRLYESTYKAVSVGDDAYFMHLPRYIHLNVADHHCHEWREGRVLRWEMVKNALDLYPWSSHSVYVGVSQKLPIIEESEVKHIFRKPDDYLNSLKEWATREFGDK